MSNLKTVRLGKGMSQSELAKKSDVNIRMLQQYEQGARNIDGVKLITLLKMCRALDCKLSDIVESTELSELTKEYEMKK